jgi:hypothetical protein
MDSRRKFDRADIPYYQDWIRKVSGRSRIWIVPMTIDGMLRTFANVKMWKESSEEENRRDMKVVLETLMDGCAWALRRRILINVDLFDRLGYTTAHVRATLLHEVGHVIHRRKGHGKSGKEFLAHLYAMRKASRLGLERELRFLRFGAWIWYRYPSGNAIMDRRYRIAFRMLRDSGLF